MKNLDDYVLPIGFNRGKKLKDVPLEDLDKFLGWLEDHGARPDVQKALSQYLKNNHFQLEEDGE